MLKFCSLYSGSSGNSLFIESNESKILIDCGVSCKKLSEALISLNTSIEDIDAIFITHEHSDHIKGLKIISDKYNIPIYANKDTLLEIKKTFKGAINENIFNEFKNNNDFNFKDLNIHPFDIPHDAVNPCGFSIDNGKKKLSIATDCGHVNDVIMNNLENSSFILLESNYDPSILQVSKYPYRLKERIKGPLGHLSNSTAAQTISYLVGKDLKEVMLGHLSKENNFPELAYQTVTDTLIDNNIDTSKIKISVASRDYPGRIIKI